MSFAVTFIDTTGFVEKITGDTFGYTGGDNPQPPFNNRVDAERYVLARAKQQATLVSDYRIIEENDMINSPPHYARLNPQPREVMRKWGLNSNLAAAVKYIARAGHKDGVDPTEDLNKAISYLQYEIEVLKEEKNVAR